MPKVLIADDTKNIRNLLNTCLVLNGYEVKSATNGEEALALFRTENFDLAFLDIKMPEISGTEVLRRIRSIGITTPVVIMTAFATVKNAVECTKLGAVAYLQKPFTTDKIKATLEELELEHVENDLLYTYLNSGKELLEKGNVSEAFQLFKRALSVNPSCGECYYWIGKIHELWGNASEANQFYTIAMNFKNNP